MTGSDTHLQQKLLEAHRETVEEVIRIGGEVSDAWPGTTVADSDFIVEPLDRMLGISGLEMALLELLRDAVGFRGDSLPSEPVPAPPYLAVTSRGPICRATGMDNGRVVVELELFDVERQPTQYRFLDPDPEDCLTVSVR